MKLIANSVELNSCFNQNSDLNIMLYEQIFNLYRCMCHSMLGEKYRLKFTLLIALNFLQIQEAISESDIDFFMKYYDYFISEESFDCDSISD